MQESCYYYGWGCEHEVEIMEVSFVNNRFMAAIPFFINGDYCGYLSEDTAYGDGDGYFNGGYGYEGEYGR